MFRDRQVSAFSVSLAIHLASFAMLLLAMRHAVHAPVPAPETADRGLPRIMWLNAPGPGGRRWRRWRPPEGTGAPR
jgi:hypothetical protein